MKKYVLLCIVLLLGVACSSDSKSGRSIYSEYTELEVTDSNTISPKRLTGEIGEVGEVDLYRVHLTETNRGVQIKCTQKLDDDDDISGNQQELTLLMQIYAEDADGNLTMLAGEHAVEGSPLPADLKQSVYVDRVKDVFIHVRDLMDDDSSQRPYYISATYEAPPDGNDSLDSSETVNLVIDGAGATDEIGAVGDVDFFTFDITTAGVYDITVDYEEFLGSGLELTMTLIEQTSGDELDERSLENTGTVHMIHYFEAGSYAVSLADEGRDDFSPTSLYTISASTVSGVEAMDNDTPSAVASDVMPAQDNGAVSYYEDQDWYPITQASGTDISVLNMVFTPTDDISYQVAVYELTNAASYDSSVDTPLFVRNVLRSLNGGLQATIKLDRTMDYFVMVRAASGSDIDESKYYTLQFDTANVDDDADEDPNSNDNNSNATPLVQATDTQGKIAYRGDTDWYSFTVPAVGDQVLSVYLTVPNDPVAQYAFEIYDNAVHLLKRVQTLSSDRNMVDLKTGIPVDSGASYFIKVYDLQNDDSDDAFYTINWDVGVAVDPGNFPEGGTAVYYGEPDESANTGHQITIEYPSDTGSGDADEGTFNVETTALSVNSMAVTPQTGYTQYTSDWMTGYVDYQGDEDWFGMDLTAPPTALALAAETPWYYTIDLELYSVQSPVEFSLEFFPDSNGDHQVNSRQCWSFPVTTCNGAQAAINDDTPNTLEDPLDILLESSNLLDSDDNNPAPCIWIGSGDPSPWQGLVYFRVRDFYYMDIMNGTTRTVNPNPDNDWSVTHPYFFRVVLKFYSGSNHPPVSN